MRRAFVLLCVVGLVLIANPAVGHRDNNGHQGVAMAVTSAYRTSGGNVHATGWAMCPLGEDWGVGFHIYEAGRDRDQGMAGLSNPVLPVICDGLQHMWEADSTDVYAGGVVTAGEKNWGGKMQSPSSGAWIHKDTGWNGTVTVS